jgi:hypothetical protein
VIENSKLAVIELDVENTKSINFIFLFIRCLCPTGSVFALTYSLFFRTTIQKMRHPEQIHFECPLYHIFQLWYEKTFPCCNGSKQVLQNIHRLHNAGICCRSCTMIYNLRISSVGFNVWIGNNLPAFKTKFTFILKYCDQSGFTIHAIELEFWQYLFFQGICRSG